MIDGLNFILYNVHSLNTERLIDLKIVYNKLKIKRLANGNSYMQYGDIKYEFDDNVDTTGIGFNYNDIYFMYLKQYEVIIICANAHRVLHKTDICLSDLYSYIERLEEIVMTVLNIPYSQLLLHRIDYYVDLQIDEARMYEYLRLLQRCHKNKYKHIAIKKEYDSSVYLSSKFGQRRINIYDKYKCELNKYYDRYTNYKHTHQDVSFQEYKNSHLPYYQLYNNILRIEVQNKKALIKKESKKAEIQIKNTENVILLNRSERSLEGFWNKESMQEYYFNFLYNYLYPGTYYKLDKAKELINNSDYDSRWKLKLKNFITAINEYGISSIIKSKRTEHETWYRKTVNDYIEKLNAIGINIRSQDILEYELDYIITTINKSDYSDSWKEKLMSFSKLVNEYGLKAVIKENEHKTYTEPTVRCYIEKLNKLNINPITLSNDSEFESLESLYVLIKRTAEQKYFDVNEIDEIGKVKSNRIPYVSRKFGTKF